MAEALRLVDYPVLDWETEQKRGTKDRVLIPWMAEQGLVWITKDDAAKRAHITEIRRARLSVLWVRGIERDKRRVSPQDLHVMLTNRLLRVAKTVAAARSPAHHELYIHGDPDEPKVSCHQLNLERIEATRRLSRARHAN